MYASDVCNVVKYATVSPGRPGCVLLKFAHRPTLLHRSNTNIEYFIKMATQTESYLNSSTQPAPDDIWPLFLDQNIVTHESCMVTCSWHAHVEQSEIVLSGCIQEIAIPVWTHARDNSYSCDGQMPPRRDAAAYDQRNNWSAISWTTVSCKLWFVLFIWGIYAV